MICIVGKGRKSLISLRTPEGFEDDKSSKDLRANFIYVSQIKKKLIMRVEKGINERSDQ